MRVLIVADIHANLPALRAINEQYDACICLGDIVDYGPDPGPCLEWVRTHAQWCVRGNHDHGVAQRVPARGHAGYGYLAAATRGLSIADISESDRQFLAAMPLHQYVRIGDTVFYLVHASPRDPMDEYLTESDVETWTRRVQDLQADVVLVGHSHRQFVLTLPNGTMVINPGSVGQPRDGDPRAAYALMDGRLLTMRRIEYPVEETVSRLSQRAIPDDAKHLAAHIWRTGGHFPEP